MSLVRRLTLREDTTLGIEPAPQIESLRGSYRQVAETPFPANQEIVLEGIRGNAMEIAAEVHPGAAREVCINVLRSPNGEECTAINFYRQGHTALHRKTRLTRDALAIDTSRSSLLRDVFARPPEVARFGLGDGEPLKLRVFIDKSVVEVFANGEQCVALRVYPQREDSVGVSIRAQGSEAMLRSLQAWQMNGIYT